MQLKVDEEKVFFVDYGDLDEFINHHYPNLQNKFEFVADEEMSNDSSKQICVDGKVDEGSKAQIQEGEGMFMTNPLLNDACRRGLLEKGMYVIRVSW